jgi:3-methyladenine DNA glycosylase/8-oxoguanine DNA glycosylase
VNCSIRARSINPYGLEQLPTPTELEQIAAPWRPYRTLACEFLWARSNRRRFEPRYGAV